jgi:K+-sensing histidine kinase KdpD
MTITFLQTIADLIALAIDRDRLAAQAAIQCRQTDRMRSEVLAASHELRNLLTAIQGYASAHCLMISNGVKRNARNFCLNRD